MANLFVVIAIVIALFLGATILLPRFDYHLIIIKSGSMEPTIGTGSAVIIKKEDAYAVGDVITFVRAKDGLITHRIVAINDNGGVFYTTKGDANESTDVSHVGADDVRGKVILTVPFVGYVTTFLRTRTGIMILIMIPTVYFIGREVRKIITEIKKRNEKSEG